MHLWLRVSLAVVLAAVTGLLGFLIVFILVGKYGACPPDDRTCDLPMMAGFALGMIVGPLIAIVVGILSFRRLSRTRKA